MSADVDAAWAHRRAEYVELPGASWRRWRLEANEGATRLYERVGFRPFYRQLLAEV